MKKLIVLFIFGLTSLFSASSLYKDSTDIVLDGKPTMLIFTTQTCPYCDVFKKDLHENKELNEMAKKMNIHIIPRDQYKEYTMWGETTNLKTLEMNFAIKATPNVIIFDKTGRKIWQVPGYADPKIMIPYLKFVEALDAGTMQITDWRKYLQDAGIIK
ncbi:MAG: thioredoxin fold domain-containing protein [Campylobacterota bacterium]|nr:thioredoxin fold domain-containing protein [Campylobacterota bacterium]